MQFINVTQAEAEDKDGKLNQGYERWAYSWKRVIPDTPEQIAENQAKAAKVPNAIKELKDLIIAHDVDETRVKLTDLLERIKKLEVITGVR
jgi:hypothetical protein